MTLALEFHKKLIQEQEQNVLLLFVVLERNATLIRTVEFDQFPNLSWRFCCRYIIRFFRIGFVAKLK